MMNSVVLTRVAMIIEGQYFENSLGTSWIFNVGSEKELMGYGPHSRSTRSDAGWGSPIFSKNCLPCGRSRISGSPPRPMHRLDGLLDAHRRCFYSWPRAVRYQEESNRIAWHDLEPLS